MGLPQGMQLQSLKSSVAAAVDGRSGRQLTAISRGVQEGSPKEGGFGLLPLESHVRARAAKWALQLVCAPLMGCSNAFGA